MQLTPESLSALVIGGATCAMAVPIIAKMTGRGSGFLGDLGFAAGPRGNARAWVSALVVACAYIAFTAKGIPLVAEHWRDASWLKGLSVVAAVAAGIVEEAFFRRWIMDALRTAGKQPWAQVVSSGLTFGLAHAAWGLLGGNVQMAIGAAVSTAALGTALAFIYLTGGRSLAPCIAAHVLIDAVIEPGLMLAAIGGQMGT